MTNDNGRERPGPMPLDLFLEAVERGEVPESAPLCAYYKRRSYYDLDESVEGRSVCSRNGMWAIVTKQLARDIADYLATLRVRGHSPRVLEVMAGVGWLAKALQDQGIQVTPTDDHSWYDEFKRKPLVDVIRMDAVEAVEKLGKDHDVLLISWPPYNDSTICRVCEAWGSDKPIIYIGESDGGNCAPPEFFNSWQHDRDVDIYLPHWQGMHDQIEVGVYVPREYVPEKNWWDDDEEESDSMKGVFQALLSDPDNETGPN